MVRASRLTVGLGMAVVVVALLACKKKEESSSSGSSSSASSGESTGVPECDEYLNKYEACLKEKVPAVARPALEDAMKKNRETYKSLAASPATKAALPNTCKQALEATKTAMASYGCTW